MKIKDIHKIDTFLNEQPVTYEDFQKISAEKYRHVASFALWPQNYDGHDATFLTKARCENDKDGKRSRTYFNDNLSGNLHKNVILLGLNFGARSDKKYSLENLLRQDMVNQYRGRGGREASAYRGYGPIKYDYLDEQTHYNFKKLISGAYMTDLFKWDKNQINNSNNIPKPNGISTKTGNELMKYLNSDLPNVLNQNITGLKDELETLGLDTDKHFVIFLLGSSFVTTKNNYSIIDELKDAFPTAYIGDDFLYHYSASNNEQQFQNHNIPVFQKYAEKIIDWY